MLRRGLCILGLLITPFMATPCYSEDHRLTILKKLQLPQERIEVECSKHSVYKGALGEELFYVKDCFILSPGRPEVEELKKAPGASKGRVTFPYGCTLVSRDYYAGNVKKERKKEEPGKVTADYVYAFGELTFSNIQNEGPHACPAPITDQMKAIVQNKP